MNTLIQWINDFHFIRPWLLLCLPISVLLYFLARHQYQQASGWSAIIDKNLLSHLMNDSDKTNKKSYLLYVLVSAWVIASLAIAGPAWKKTEQSIVKNQHVLIMILDLSLSMYAQDESPSRLIAAKRKITDILHLKKDGQFALIVYSGDAHIVTPITDDAETIATLLPALEPSIMPKWGSNLSDALTLSETSLKNAGIKKADIIILSDEIEPRHFEAIRKASNNGLTINIITLGSTEGAPIPLDRGFLKDNNDSVILAKLNESEILSFAHSHNIRAIHSSKNDSDIAHLVNNTSTIDETDESNQSIPLWQDQGHWLVLLLLPFALSLFRRGWILLLLVFIFPDNSYAWEWQDLWKNPNQQAAEAFKNGQHEKAAATFTDPQWKAAAEYKNGHFQEALTGFSDNTNARDLYNKANTLAQMGQLNEALSAYDQALKLNPEFKDASSNKAVVEKIIQQQENKKEQENNQQQKKDDASSNDDSSSQNSTQNAESSEKNSEQADKPSDHSQSQQSDQNQPSNNTEKNPHPEDANTETETDKAAQENADDNKQQSAPNNDSEKESAENKNKENTKTAKEGTPSDKQSQHGNTESTAPSLTPLEQEKKQALEQWLKRIPDSPGDLLKNKFQYEHQQNRENNNITDKESEQLW